MLFRSQSNALDEISGIRKAPKTELLVSSTPDNKKSGSSSAASASWNTNQVCVVLSTRTWEMEPTRIKDQ